MRTRPSRSVRPTFTCYLHLDGRPEADVLVSARGHGLQHPVCYDHAPTVLRELFAEDPRADVQVRDARTWHTPR